MMRFCFLSSTSLAVKFYQAAVSNFSASLGAYAGFLATLRSHVRDVIIFWMEFPVGAMVSRVAVSAIGLSKCSAWVNFAL